MSGKQKEVVFVKSVPMNKVRIDGGTQIRMAISEEAVSEYAENIENLPPVDIYFDGKDYWLADGFHRYFAHKRGGKSDIQAKVRSGTARDAKLFACGANSSHGLPRTNADKRAAVIALLDDPEWSKEESSWIAKAAAVSKRYVNEIKSERRLAKIKADEKAGQHAGGNVPTQNQPVASKTQLFTQLPGRGTRPAACDPDDEEPGAEAQAAPATEPAAPAPSADLVGHKLPDDEKIAEAFAQVPVFRSLMARVSQLKGEFEQIMDGPAGSWPTRHRQEWAAAVDHLHSIIRFCIPHSVCPYCGGQSQKCDACFRSGYMPQDVWKRVPGDVKGNLEPEEAAA